ncbi:MAG TPA: hypothetical protein VNH18_24160 [Bryobacteraceae bacterium]|nr:hypothetical protein [Bryobacteraceae bacterium]
MSSALLRLVALVLLLTGSVDFISFDRRDLFDSMNRTVAIDGGVCSAPGFTSCTKPSHINTTALPDDDCLFCGVGIPAASVGMDFTLPVNGFKAHSALTFSAHSPDSPHLPPKIRAA